MVVLQVDMFCIPLCQFKEPRVEAVG